MAVHVVCTKGHPTWRHCLIRPENMACRVGCNIRYFLAGREALEVGYR